MVRYLPTISRSLIRVVASYTLSVVPVIGPVRAYVNERRRTESIREGYKAAGKAFVGQVAGYSLAYILIAVSTGLTA